MDTTESASNRDNMVRGVVCLGAPMLALGVMIVTTVAPRWTGRHDGHNRLTTSPVGDRTEPILRTDAAGGAAPVALDDDMLRDDSSESLVASQRDDAGADESPPAVDRAAGLAQLAPGGGRGPGGNIGAGQNNGNQFGSGQPGGGGQGGVSIDVKSRLSAKPVNELNRAAANADASRPASRSFHTDAPAPR